MKSVTLTRLNLRNRSLLKIWLLPCFIAMFFFTANRSEAAESAVRLSLNPVKDNTDWKKYVLTTKGDYVWPQSVSVKGNTGEIRNPEGILKADPQENLSDEHTATITATGDGSSAVIADLGTLGSGFIELGVVKASGAPIRMSYAEYLPVLGKWGDGDTRENTVYFKYGESGGPDDNPDGRADVFPPPLITPPKAYSVLISPGIRGSQRYIAITLDGPGTATFDFVRVRKTNYRGKYDGHFLCSDDTLNRAWYGSAFAIELSTARDTRFNPDANWIILDGPKRDRTVWNNDLRTVGLSAYYQGIDYQNIMRDCIYLFAVQQEPDGTMPFSSRLDVPFKPYMDPGPPDGTPAGFDLAWNRFLRIDSFSLWWIIQLDDYLKYSGDIAAVRPLMPAARRVMDFFGKHTEKNSVLWVTGSYDGKIPYNWHPADECKGIDVYANEAYYGALRSMARLERIAAGNKAASERLDRLAARVKKELVSRFWDEKAGAMLHNSSAVMPDHPAESNAGALLFNILDTPKAEKVITHLIGKLGTEFGTLTSEYKDNPYMAQYISPYMMANEAIGRFNYNDGKGALDLIRKAWGNMLKYGPTPWEESGINGKPENPRATAAGQGMGFLGLAHAWSTAVPALSMKVIGVTPVTDGYARYNIAPNPVDLEWAQGRIPVPGGYISVKWKRGKNNSSFIMTVESPVNKTGDIAVPLLGSNRNIAIDGKTAWKNGKPANGFTASPVKDAVLFIGIKGNHTFAWIKEQDQYD
ncbi:MAG: hypothetical protein JW864_00485 [Spirochaetes bacterium]|nr:hypothetical protein [Spirochaetota bacterium]